MNTRSIHVLVLLLMCSFFSCKKEEVISDKKEVIALATESVSIHISGMTCEIGCAKTIESKLSKKEGVASAKVVFTDSIAKVEFDRTKTSSEDLITFINGIAGGDSYVATEVKYPIKK